MKKYYLVCDHCGKTVDELYTINFNAIESLKSTDFYFPELELCEDCVDELCELIDSYYNEENKDCKDCDVDFEDYEKCFDCSLFKNEDEDYSIDEHNSVENCYVPELEECGALEEGEMPQIEKRDKVFDFFPSTSLFSKAEEVFNSLEKNISKDKNNNTKKVVFTEKDLPLEERKNIKKKLIQFCSQNTNENLEKTIREISDWISTLNEAQKLYATCAAFDIFFDNLSF